MGRKLRLPPAPAMSPAVAVNVIGPPLPPFARAARSLLPPDASKLEARLIAVPVIEIAPPAPLLRPSTLFAPPPALLANVADTGLPMLTGPPVACRVTAPPLPPLLVDSNGKAFCSEARPPCALKAAGSAI